jgi:hypothetical protein
VTPNQFRFVHVAHVISGATAAARLELIFVARAAPQ